jgi:hypothetical protein
MKAFISEWKIAAFWFVLFSVNSLCTCITASMAGSVWANLGPQDKFTVVISIIGNWTGTIMAFVSKQSKRETISQ